MPITPLPTPVPSRTDPANFAARGDTFLGALPTFATEANALADEVNANAAICEGAAQTVNVSAWISGATYAVGVNVYDTTSFLTYRRKVAGAGTTRPGLDGTNWQLLTGFGNVDLTSAQTVTNKTLGAGSVWAGGAIPVANGGTGATTAEAAFTALKQSASTTATGVVELATTAETQTGTDTARAVTPAGFSGSSLGHGQTWQSVARTSGVTYTNSTGRPILVHAWDTSGPNLTGYQTLQIVVAGVLAAYSRQYLATDNGSNFVSAIVPIGATYIVSISGSFNAMTVAELR